MQLKSCHTRVGLGLAAILLATPALAALKDRGPVAPIGFPLWYRDNGIPAAGVNPAVGPTALELCTAATPSPNPGAAGAPMCFPWVPDPAGFPGNISGEIFYAVADAATAGLGYDIRLVTALEAAYATGTPVRGSEIVFARIRIVMNVQTAGTYVVTHPYGVEIFPDVQPGTRAVFFTSDIGATGVQFDGALGGAVGPFLRWDVLNAGEILTITTPTAVEEYLGDPNLLHTVTGSPFNTNFLRVERVGDPAATAQTPLFTVVGKKYTAPIPTPLAVTRATYSRTGAAASLDVFATANPGQQLVVADQNVLAPRITPTIAAANASSYLGHFVLPFDATLPATVTVTNTTDVPANVVVANVIDLVTVSDAFYDPATQVLTVQAFSSDASTAPPALTLAGFGAVDAAGRTFAAGAVPPETVIVSSSAGGSDTHPVRVLQSLAVAPGNTSLAANDTFTTSANTPATFDVIANDTITSPLAAVIITSPPAHGTAVAGTGLALGTVLYTPALNYNGPDSFAYALQNTAGALSNVASASISVVFVALPPTAVNDLLTTAAGVTNTAAILANDTAAVGTALVPTSVVLSPTVTPTTAGTITYSAATQLVTFTPAAGFTGAASATYTVANNFGQPSNVATINIQVNAAAEVINITRAQFRTGTSRWTVTGTSTVATGTVTIFNGSTAAAPVIGTAPIVGGAFNFDLVGGPPPSASRLILIRSSNGGSRVAAVTIRL